MNKIYASIVILVLVFGFIKWYSANQYDAGYNKHKAETLTAVNDAVAKARKDEQSKQKKVDDAAQKQFNELNNINDQLNVDLDRLRKRASRRQPANNTSAVCKGASGKSLSSEDAGFLTREAARADKIRSALKGCYTHADTVASQQ